MSMGPIKPIGMTTPAGVSAPTASPVAQMDPQVKSAALAQLWQPRFAAELKARWISGIDVAVYGKGEIGDKARQLIQKTAWCRALGFRTPRRIVLAQDFFDSFFQEHGLGTTLTDVEPSPDSARWIMRSPLSLDHLAVLQAAGQLMGNGPIAVRSSAMKDARGTGTYESVFVHPDLKSVARGVYQVLASYFSSKAMLFREQAKTGEGFGIIIEPVIGQPLMEDDETCFAPALSGYAYTSTARGEGYVSIVPGLGGGVDSRFGETITRSDYLRYNSKYSPSLYEYLYKMMREVFRGPHMTFLRRTERSVASVQDHYTGMALDVRDGCVSFGKSQIDYRKEIERASIMNHDLTPFFDQIERLQPLFGKPQYIEWAMTVEGKTPRFWITQIADVHHNLDIMDFGDLPPAILTADSIQGSCNGVAPAVVNFSNMGQLNDLRRYNQERGGYVLVFSGTLIGDDSPFQYESFSNAAVAVEDMNTTHRIGRSPLSHFNTNITERGIVHGLLSDRWWWRKQTHREKKYGSLEVYEGPFRVIASERQNRLIVCEEKSDCTE